MVATLNCKVLSNQGLGSYADWRRMTRSGIVLPLAVIGLISCHEPFAAHDRHPQSQDEARQKALLTEHDQDQALEALHSLADGQNVQNPPHAAPDEMRWSDVPAAVDLACGDAEMA